MNLGIAPLPDNALKRTFLPSVSSDPKPVPVDSYISSK